MRYNQKDVGCICNKMQELNVKQGTIIKCFLSESTWIVICFVSIDVETGYLTGLDHDGKSMTIYCKSVKSFEICEESDCMN
ncbi:hypothetical protein [Haloplasma contractile]|uniref:Uncharacterized protein n=1 Tax=Haloplasma contractile SSD-17B TaxID=1033810 RepID=U2FKU7_9MOLU|nr:hypothetical protein [Haloplasma contractile]ERJ11839.1 hypothetical protein HLPCO_002078 [Haloplasma contractile SSD-17B]